MFSRKFDTVTGLSLPNNSTSKLPFVVLKGRKKPLPLSGAGELKPLLQVEEEGARLAKFLDVNLEGLK